jgi:hypothetical protein
VIPDDQRFVHLLPNVTGWHEKSQHFFFTNCVVDSHGNVIEYEEDGTVGLDGVVYKVSREGSTPEVFFSNSGTRWESDAFKDLAEKLHENFGTESPVIALAWFCACVLKPWLFAFNSTFPILFVFGKRGSGKTRLCKWLTRIFFNADKNSTDTLIGQNSAAFIRNRASQLPYMPLWLDEFRNTDQSLRHLDVLRGIYDHSSAGISGGVIGTNKTFRLTCALVISGEDVPDDPTGALNERMITVRIPETIPGTQYSILEQLQYSFDGIFMSLLKRREEFVVKIKHVYDQLVERHRKAMVSSRIAINHALIHAVSRVVLGVTLDEEAIDATFAEIKRDDEEEDPILDMLMRACSIRNTAADPGTLTRAIFCRRSIHPAQDGEPAMMFNLRDVYDAWAAAERRAGRYPQTLRTVKKRLKDTKWILDTTQVYRMPSKGLVRVHEVDLTRVPDDLRSAAFGMAGEADRMSMRSRFGQDIGPLHSEETV